MEWAADVIPGVWIGAVTVVVFGVVPALALGRVPWRTSRWPEFIGGAAWSTLAAILLVPPLAALRLLNWITALLVPLAWPLALCMYRHHSGPPRAFREQCRRVTLRALQWHLQRRPSWRGTAPGAVAAAGAIAIYRLAAREVRFASVADYDTLAHARALLAGGEWIMDPAASVAAIVSRLAAVDPMQALRFLRPFVWGGSLVAAAVGRGR